MADNDPDVERERLIQLLERIGQVGRFVDLHCLGDGGASGNFSALLSGVDQTTKRPVALKFLLPKFRAGYREEAFRREAKLLEELRGHPDIVQLINPCTEFRHVLRSSEGFEWQVEAPYYVLELARTDVGAIIASSEWRATDLLLAFRAMCRAVQRLHAKLIAHRDLKPTNFLVIERATIRLSDFGGARLIDGLTSALATYAAPPGDRRYSAPEMHAILHEENPSIAFLGDFFSLGAILFEMFSGTVLGTRLYDLRFLGGLQHVMMNVKIGQRQRIFDGFVSDIADARPIPSVSTFGSAMPSCIIEPIDSLVRSLAALDYRKRLCDFSRIFNRVDVCLLILRNETVFRNWLEAKQRRRLRDLPVATGERIA